MPQAYPAPPSTARIMPSGAIVRTPLDIWKSMSAAGQAAFEAEHPAPLSALKRQFVDLPLPPPRRRLLPQAEVDAQSRLATAQAILEYRQHKTPPTSPPLSNAFCRRSGMAGGTASASEAVRPQAGCALPAIRRRRSWASAVTGPVLSKEGAATSAAPTLSGSPEQHHAADAGQAEQHHAADAGTAVSSAPEETSPAPRCRGCGRQTVIPCPFARNTKEGA